MNDHQTCCLQQKAKESAADADRVFSYIPSANSSKGCPTNSFRPITSEPVLQLFPMNRAPEISERTLKNLHAQYLQCREELAAFREAQIERLGDFMCERSLCPPDNTHLQQLQRLVDAERHASERIAACSLDMARRLTVRIGERFALAPAEPSGSFHL